MDDQFNMNVQFLLIKDFRQSYKNHLDMHHPFLQQMLCTHTFSPNWYKPQCLLFHHEHLYYASNYILYDYGLPERRILRDACFRKIAMSAGMDSKNIKIHAIAEFSTNLMFIATNQPYLIFFDKYKWEPISIIKISQYNIKSIMMVITSQPEDKKKQDSLLLASDQNENHRFLIKLEPEIGIVEHEEIKNQKQKVKSAIMLKSNRFALILTVKNTVQILSNSFKAYQGKFEQQLFKDMHQLTNEFCLSADFLEEENEGDVARVSLTVLSRNKANSMFINYVKFLIVENSEEEKEIINLKVLEQCRSEFKVTYPKVLMQKVKKNQKAAMTIKKIIISAETHVIVTGKLGEIFSINVGKWIDKKVNAISVKPHSIEESQSFLTIWDDSKHFKEIYSIYEHQKRLFMISTDQNLSIWSLGEKKLPKHKYSIKFITAEIQQFFSSEADPGIIYFLLRDSVIRSMAPEGEGSQYLNEYWKHTKKFNKILKVVCHITEPGIVAMVTKCNHILVYDIYEDRLMRIIELNNKEIINISYEHGSIIEAIQQLNEHAVGVDKGDEEKENKWSETNAKVNKYFMRKEPEDIGLLIQQKDEIIFLSHQDKADKEKEFTAIRISRHYRAQRIHNCKLWDRNSLIFTHSKGPMLKMRMLFDSKFVNLEINSQFSGRFTYKLLGKWLYVVEYKNKKVSLSKFEIAHRQGAEGISAAQVLVRDISSKMIISAEQLILDFSSKKASFYNQKDDAVGVIDFEDEENITVSCYQLTSKVQSLTFYKAHYLAFGFKDQSVKVLKISEMTQFSESGKNPYKKVKKEQVTLPKIQEKQEKEEKEEKAQEIVNGKKSEKKMKQMDFSEGGIVVPYGINKVDKIYKEDDWLSEDDVE